MTKERILVIRLGALGDLVLCMGAFAAIRRQHPNAEIALLTAPAFAGFCGMMPWFDRIIHDQRPRPLQLGKWWNLIKTLRAFAPTRVYDFQGKPRQSILFHALGRPEWNGAAKGCSHPRPWPPAEKMHCAESIAAQIKVAGLTYDETPDLSWLDASVDGLGVPEHYAVLIAGCAPQHPHKRWPAAHYAELAKKLGASGLPCVAVGTKDDAASIQQIRELAPDVIDLSGKTSLKQLGTVLRNAELVVGNDTGPTHLAAILGAKTVALMSERVNPYWSSPRGPRTSWMQGNPIGSLSVDVVANRAFGEE